MKWEIFLHGTAMAQQRQPTLGRALELVLDTKPKMVQVAQCQLFGLHDQILRGNWCLQGKKQ